MITESDFFTESGELVPGFKGIGPFVGRRAHEFSEAEQVVLRHLYTNIDSNVYCASDHMTSQLWALIMGQFARSPSSAKERTLQVFRDVHKKDPDNVPSLEAIAGAIKRSEDITLMLEAHNQKSGEFIDEYGIKYGHASLRDSGTIRIVFEGVSQRATKYLEAAREGAYQERSTRAVPFTLENLGMPLEIRGTPFEGKFVVFAEKVVRLYDRIFEDSKNWLSSTYSYLRGEADHDLKETTKISDAKLTDRDWNSVVSAKAFDIARSLLPQFMTTSLGITLTARRFQDMLTEWQSSESEEMLVLGRAAQVESSKIMSILMKYGDSSNFYSSLPERRRNLNSTLVQPGDIGYQNVPISSRMITHTPDLEDWVLASILFNGSDSSHTLTELKDKVSRLSSDERVKIARSQFEGRRSYELVPKSMEVGAVTFERILDIGAYRDMQRQRGDRQQIAPYTTFAYHMPEEIRQLGKDLEFRFHDVMSNARGLHEELISAGMHSVAENVSLMANTVRQIVTEDPVQGMYVAKLRSQPAGADSYRAITIQETQQLLGLMPSFQGLVEYDSTPKYYLNRLPEAIKMAADRIIKKAKS